MTNKLNNNLRNSLHIEDINHIAIELLEKFEDNTYYDNKYICIQFDRNNYSILPNTIANGTVFKIPIRGNLSTDGYELALLYLTKDSEIKTHKHVNDVEQYTLIKGELNINGISQLSNRCLIEQSHKIDKVSNPTIIKTLKISKKLIMESKPNYSDGQANKKDKIIE